MTTITVEVSDELATRLAPHAKQLPTLLPVALDLLLTQASEAAEVVTNTEYPLLHEVMDFLLSRPTPNDILAFRVSATAQERLEALLDKNREDHLTPNEMAELETYSQINHLLILLKAQAQRLSPVSN
jgi:hypothetical protein